MYNKLFTKILDSTIWLESDATRLVWITFLAIMDEDGFVALSSVGNVAARARVSEKAAEKAIEILSSPDQKSTGQEYEGKRVERVPSGWMVLNARKYGEISTRENAREKTRLRVARHRECNADVTPCNADVTPCNADVTPSDTYSDTYSDKEKPMRSKLRAETAQSFEVFYLAYPRKRSRGAAERTFRRINPDENLLGRILAAVERLKLENRPPDKIPYPATWLNAKGWLDEQENPDATSNQQRTPSQAPSKISNDPSKYAGDIERGKSWDRLHDPGKGS